MTVIGVCGCSQPYQQVSLYGLTDTPAESQVSPKLSDAAPGLLIGTVSVAPPFGGTQFTYVYADGSMRQDPYASFIAPPAELLAGAVEVALSRSGLFRTVSSGSGLGQEKFTIVITIDELAAMFAEAASPAVKGSDATAVPSLLPTPVLGKGSAVIRGRVWLLSAGSTTPVVLEALSIGATCPITSEDAGGVARSISAATNDFLSQLQSQLAASSALRSP